MLESVPLWMISHNIECFPKVTGALWVHDGTHSSLSREGAAGDNTSENIKGF